MDIRETDPLLPAINLTCPACHITADSTRRRSMCPFCGNFYDPNAESDINVRSNSRLHNDEQHLRLPRIVRK